MITELRSQIQAVQRSLIFAEQSDEPREAYLHRGLLQDLMDIAARHGIDVTDWVDRALLASISSGETATSPASGGASPPSEQLVSRQPDSATHSAGAPRSLTPLVPSNLSNLPPAPRVPTPGRNVHEARCWSQKPAPHEQPPQGDHR